MGLLSWFKELFENKNIIYSSDICSDCQTAEEFFEENDIEIEIKKIEDDEVRNELKEKYGKVLVPTIILGNNKYIGFENNKREIISYLKK